MSSVQQKYHNKMDYSINNSIYFNLNRIVIKMCLVSFKTSLTNNFVGPRKDNQDQIKKSRTKLSREEQELEELIELEKEEADRLRKEVLQEQLQVKKLAYLFTYQGFISNK